MQTTVEFLDSVRAAHGLTSDYQLAKHLGCTPSAIGNYRHGKSKLDEAMACKVAADLKLDPGYVLACIAAERSSMPAAKAAWQRTAEVLGGIAAAVLIVVALPYLVPVSGVAHLEPASFDNNAFYTSGLYIMRVLAMLTAFTIMQHFGRYEAAPVRSVP